MNVRWFELLLVHKRLAIWIVLSAVFTLRVIDTLRLKIIGLIDIMPDPVKISGNLVKLMLVLVRPEYVLELIFKLLVVAILVR